MSENTAITNPITTLRGIITGDKMKAQFAAALPSHLSAERFCRIALTALTRTPKLADCTQESLFKCLLDLSAMGLEPDGRRAHLIPYGNACTLIIDWKGLAELAMRSGIIAKLHADIVCENDAFDFNLGEIIAHKVNFKEPRGKMYAAYAMAVTKDGPVFVQVLTKEEIDGIRKRSKAGNSGPWVTDYNEMAKKTAFRRLSKWLPLSAEFRDAIDKDDDNFQPGERDAGSSSTSAPTKPRLFATNEPLSSSHSVQGEPATAYLVEPSSTADETPVPATTQPVSAVVGGTGDTLAAHADLAIRMDSLEMSFEDIARVIKERKMMTRDFDELADIPEKVVVKLLQNWEQVRADIGK